MTSTEAARKLSFQSSGRFYQCSLIIFNQETFIHKFNFFLFVPCSDKLFIIASQYGKVGNLIEIRRDVAQKDDPSSAVYNIR